MVDGGPGTWPPGPTLSGPTLVPPTLPVTWLASDALRSTNAQIEFLLRRALAQSRAAARPRRTNAAPRAAIRR